MLRVRAHNDFARCQIMVYVTQEWRDEVTGARHLLVKTRNEHGFDCWEEVAEGAEMPCTYTFPDEIAGELYKALQDLYADTEQRRMIVRLDVEGTQDRVDRMLRLLSLLSDEGAT